MCECCVGWPDKKIPKQKEVETKIKEKKAGTEAKIKSVENFATVSEQK